MSWELGWVIKRHDALEYLGVAEDGLFYWTKNALDAIHLYREEDARAMLKGLQRLLHVEYASISIPRGLEREKFQPAIVHYAWI